MASRKSQRSIKRYSCSSEHVPVCCLSLSEHSLLHVAPYIPVFQVKLHLQQGVLYPNRLSAI